MTGAAPTADIARLLGDELSTLRDFHALLRREQDLLVKNDADRVRLLADEKSALAQRLGVLLGQREGALVTAGFGRGRNGMDAWLAAHGEAASTSRWQELLALAIDARALNETNGRLIGTLLQHNQQALAALMTAANQAMTYGPQGVEAGISAIGTGRLLGSA